jgi:hypothetical protein
MKTNMASRVRHPGEAPLSALADIADSCVRQRLETLDRIRKTQQLRVQSLTIQTPNLQGVQANPVLIVQAQITAIMVHRKSQRT